MFVCKKCGGDNVQHVMWVKSNEQEPVDDFGSFGEFDTTWCEDCRKHGTVVEAQEVALCS